MTDLSPSTRIINACEQIVRDNRGKNPTQLAAIASALFTDEEKLELFDTLIETPLQFALNNAATSVGTQVDVLSGITPRPVRSGKGRGALRKFGQTIDRDGLFNTLLHTHNPKRNDPYVKMGLVTAEDLRHRGNYFKGISTTYQHEGERCHLLMSTMANRKVKTLGEMWDDPEIKSLDTSL